jgi:xanthine/CO dehydrogenase XdhC/CoxF family maturation factor
MMLPWRFAPRSAKVGSAFEARRPKAAGLLLFLEPLPDRLPAILFSRQPAAHGRKLGFRERHSTANTLRWNLDEGRAHAYLAPRLRLDLDEAGFAASGYLACKLYSVGHNATLFAVG